MNLLSFSVSSIFHAIIVEKQLIKHDILTHCLTCNFRYAPIQLIPVGVEKSNGTLMGTSCLENCKFHLFITYLAYENKNKHVPLAIEQ